LQHALGGHALEKLNFLENLAGGPFCIVAKGGDEVSNRPLLSRGQLLQAPRGAKVQRPKAQC